MPIGVVSGDSQFVPDLIPGIAIILDAPGPLLDGRQFLRIHQRSSKRACETVLRDFHMKALPERFKPSAALRDRHKKRGPRYKQQKRAQYGNTVDLVKSGRTKQKFTGVLPKIVFRRTGSDLIHAVIQLRFPFGNTPWRSQRVFKHDMASEIKTWRPEEAERAAELYGKVYVEELIEELNKAPRLRKRAGIGLEQMAAQMGVG